ncbi:MAG TPA: trypsin-like peptidase domain-containing protein [Tepidisphaeraceae bacterium]|jgi:serine protease Do|nr:trypsin-like peptidase domain-containing protein [Tepidisphaeraceae bacterium]
MKRAHSFAAAVLLCIVVSTVVRADPPESINLRDTVVVQVVAKTKSAVVNISATKLINRRVIPFGNDPFFQEFGLGQIETVPANSLGSGFIIHEDGYVVTNNHVVDRAREITVQLDDGRKLPAELISADTEADLALLKISGKQPFPTVALGDSSDLMIGEPAIAIGNPLGYSHSVSTGIISALHRDLKDVEGKESLANLIQTDAAINPGNSGGPLLNAYGQVIGINTAIRSDAQNIGFAIPVNRLRDLIPELMNPAQVKKLGIPIKLKERRSLTPPANVNCQIVTADGSRVVSEIGGRRPRNIVDAYDLLLSARAGKTIAIRFADGKQMNLMPQPTPLPDAVIEAKAKLGITVEALTPMLAQKYGLNEEDGIFIDAVARDSVAARTGVQAGDIIVQLGRFRVSTLDDLSALLSQLPKTGRVRIAVIRNDQLAQGYLEMGKSGTSNPNDESTPND